MSLELVLLVPVLVLLTVFVLWAGRGGQVALTADLAAEEAATAAALCCEEDSGGASGREALVEDVLEARPGLGFLCIGGPRPDAGGASGGFLSEHWLKFEPGRDTGGVGVLGVQFLCETDGAVAPLRGLFPTVTFHGQASEVVVREPRFIVGFFPTRVEVVEGAGTGLVFTVVVEPALGEEVTLSYRVDPDTTTVEPEDFDGDYVAVLGLDSLGVGTVVVPAGESSVEIVLPLVVDDVFFEGAEQLVLNLTGAAPPVVVLDEDRKIWTGVVGDDDPRPYLQIIAPQRVAEGGTLEFVVRVGVESGAVVGDIAEGFTVGVSTVAAPVDSCCTWASPSPLGQDYDPVDDMLTFRPGESLSIPVPVVTLDDAGSPVGEVTEHVRLILSAPSTGAPPLHGVRWKADGEIVDDEATVSISDVTAVDAAEGDPVRFTVALDKAPAADVTLDYTLGPDGRAGAHQAVRAGSCGDVGGDYLGATGQVVIAALSQQKTFDVQTCEDVLVERDETFWVGLSRGGGEVVVPAGTGAHGTIRNDDIPVVSVSPATAEGTEGPTGSLAFTVSLSVGGRPAQLSEDVTVAYGISGDGSDPATAPGEPDADYGVTLDTAALGSTLQGTLSFTAAAPGVLSVTEHRFEVQLLADHLLEDPETFVLRLSDGDPSDGLLLADASAVGTIVDDPPPVLSVSDFTGPEGSDQSFVVTLANPRADETVTVDYVIVGGTGPGGATAPGSPDPDFEPVPSSDPLRGVLTFGSGVPAVVERTVVVSLLHDGVIEGPEELRLMLSSPSLAVLDEPYGVGTITNADAPWLTVDDPGSDPSNPVLEGQAMTFTVTLHGARAGEAVTVDYAVESRSAKAGRDFVAVTPGPLTLDMNNPTGTVDVQTLTDKIAENAETLHLVLSDQSPSHIAIDKAVGVGTVTNVNPAVVRVNNPQAVEGTDLGFMISLVDDQGQRATIIQDVTVEFATAGRTAATGSACIAPDADYLAPGGTSVTFTPGGATEHPVQVATCTDTRDEDDETVALVLYVDPDNDAAVLGDAEGIGTITDADPPAIRILGADAQEGETIIFEVVLVDTNGVETPTSEEVTVFAATEDGTAVADEDYTALSGQLTIPEGATRARVPLTVATSLDDVPEKPETFRVVLSGAANAKIDRAVATGTINPRCVIVDATPDEMADNMPPTITVHDVTVTEGAEYFLKVSFSRPLCADEGDSNGSRTFYYFYFDDPTGGVWGTAEATLDFQGQSGREYDHPVHSTWCCNKSLVSIPSYDDDFDEDDEWYTLLVQWGSSMPDHYQGIAPSLGRVTLLDDDPLPRLSVADSSADEGDPMAFTITMDQQSLRPVTVQYRTVPASGAATAGDDYIEVTWSTATFAPVRLGYGGVPGETVKTFDVETVDDGAGDSGETFLVELRAPVSSDPANPAPPLNAEIVDGLAVGAILEGDLPELRIFDASADEGATMLLRVELSEPAAQTVTVDYSTVQRPEGLRSAVEGDDYEPVVRRQLEFLAGERVKFAEVVVKSDTVTEVDETFLVELANPTGAALADRSAVGTIDGDTTCIDWTVEGAVPPAVTVTSPGAGEGDPQMTFTVHLSEPFCQGASFRGSEDGGTARRLRDYDYSIHAGMFYVPPLRTEASFTVDLIDDDIAEPDEQIRLRLGLSDLWDHRSGPIATGTIFDNDQASVSVADASGAEGGFLNFVIRLDRPSASTVTVGYATGDASPLSAVAGADYRPRSGTAVIAAPAWILPGELSTTVSVFAPQDGLDEDAETFLLQLSDPTGGASLADPDGDVAVGTITDDDPLPSLSVSDASTDEGGALVFVVTLDAPSGREVVVPVSTRDGTARAGEGDYVGVARNVVFAAGETRQTVSVQTSVESVVEGAETVFLDLGVPANATVDVGAGRGVIRDVSDRSLSVSDAVVVEGGTLAFVVGFSEGPSGREVTVRYRTRAGTAAAGDDYDDDYESAPQELRIVAGDTSATVLVPTAPDRLDEGNERLELVLSDPQGAVIVAAAASGVIIDDDPVPALRVGDTEASEGDGASAVFTLSLSEPSGRPVTVTYDTADGTAAAGTATDPGDFVAATGAMTVMAAGETSATVDVALVDDDDAEEVETFQLQVSSVTNASRDDSVGVATVTDDDGLVQVLVDDPAAVYEGEGVSAVFTVRLSRTDATDAVTVMYSTADGAAKKDDDYIAAIAQTLIFAADEEAKTVSVPLVNDDVVEVPETFRLVLASPSSNAELGDDEASVLIRDDDALPAVSVSDAPVAAEGSTATFTVGLSRSSTQPVTVGYSAVVDPFGGDAAAIPVQDFEAVAGRLTIPARATSATVTVAVPDDALDEHTETFWLRLADPTDATVDDGTGVGTIADDDPLPQLNIGDSGATEGATIRFTVTLDTASGRTVTVPWTTAVSHTGDPATPTEDFVAASGTLTFASGTTTAHIDIATVDDEVSEPDETFRIQLGQPTDATVDDGVAVGAIVDDDGLPRISIAGTELLETDSPAVFVVTLSRTSSQPVTVDYATDEDTATAGDDYGTRSGEATGTLVIPAGLDTGEISVFVAADDLSEGAETFTITLSNPVNAVIAESAGTAVGTILDDDSEPRLTVEDAEECEDGSSTEDCDVRVCRDGIQDGGLTQDRHLECLTIVADPGVCQPGACAGDGTIDFVVRLSHASAEETSVRYTTFARDAADPRDYVASSGTLVIPAGDTSASIPVVLVDDAIPEQATEDFLLRLDNPDGVELEAAAAVGTIVDDERLPKVSDAPFDAYANEDDGFNYHRVTLSHPSDLTVTVDYSFTAVEDQNPFPGIDSTPGTLTFAPGVVEQTIAVPIYDNDVASVNPSQLPGSHNHLRSFGYANTHYRLRLRNRVNATSYGQVYTGLGVVWDDETPPYVDSVAAQDILEGAGAATLTITLNRFSDQAVTATYQTLDRTATAGSDFTATTGTVTFPPGTITANLTVPILDDDIVESDESFIFKVIRDPRNSNLTVLDSAFESGRGNNATRVWIIDDDVLPEISVSDVAANENAGTVTFWVSLSRASAQDVTVDYATADGTATAGSDYAAVDDMLIIRAGDTGAEVSVDIHDDDTTESDETFELALSGAAGATITDGDATVTIIEDEGLQTISIRDISESENRESTNPGLITPGPGRFMVFAPVLDDGTDTATRPMSVDWEVLEVPSLGDEAATVGSDIRVPDQSRTLVVPAGERVGLILFEIVGDLVPERDERFLVVLSNAVGAVLGDSRAWGTIFDNDLPIVSIADVEASESDDAVVFTLQLHEPGLDPASLRYTTRARPSEGDAAALPGDDYIQTTGTLQVAAGETTATISVPIIGDSADELDETFLLELSAPNGLELRDSAGVGTITDDDPGWVINDRGVREDAGSMVFTVNRDHTSTSAVTLNYTVTGASAAGGDSCTAGADYITPSGSVTLQPAETQAEISVTVCYDDIAEGSEILLIELTGVPGRKLTGTGTIVDND